MPEKQITERAREGAQKGKSPSTQAGEFVREEIEHIRHGKRGASSPQQAIAIGLSKARRAGVKLPPPKRGKTSERTRRQAKRDLGRGRSSSSRTSRVRSRATSGALRRKGRSAASRQSLSRHARTAARRRGPAERHRAAERAVHAKGREGLRREARKAAHTRKRHASHR